MDLNRKNVRALLGVIAFAIALLAALLNIGAVMAALRTAVGAVSFFLIGLSFAFIMNTPMRNIETRLFPPLDKRLGKKWHAARRMASVALSALLIAGLLIAVVFMVIPELGRTFGVIGEQLPVFIDDATAWIQGIAQSSGRSLESMNMPQFDWVKIGDTVLGWLGTGGSNIVSNTVTVATSFASSVLNVVIGFVLALYILYQKERLSSQANRVLHAYLPERRVNRLVEIGRLATQIFGNFITGQFLEAVILGMLCFLGMTILRFPFAPMVAVLVGVTAFIPIFGALIGALVGIFLILVNQGALQAFWFLIFFFALQQIEGNLIYPHVVGKRVALPGLWVLTAVTLGGNIAGVLGMLVSVPLCSLLYALLREAVARRNEAKERESRENAGK